MVGFLPLQLSFFTHCILEFLETKETFWFMSVIIWEANNRGKMGQISEQIEQLQGLHSWAQKMVCFPGIKIITVSDLRAECPQPKSKNNSTVFSYHLELYVGLKFQTTVLSKCYFRSYQPLLTEQRDTLK